MKNKLISDRSLKYLFHSFSLLLPISAILLASQNSLEFINFSYIGNTMEKRLLLILWGFSSGCYFFCANLYLYRLLKHRDSKFIILSFISCMMMFLSTLVPYLPKIYPFLSFLHLILSFGSTLIYVVVFYTFVYSMMLYDIDLYNKAMGSYTMIVFACVAVLMAYGGVNSLVEMMFTILMPIYQSNLIKQIINIKKSRSEY